MAASTSRILGQITTRTRTPGEKEAKEARTPGAKGVAKVMILQAGAKAAAKVAKVMTGARVAKAAARCMCHLYQGRGEIMAALGRQLLGEIVLRMILSEVGKHGGNLLVKRILAMVVKENHR